MNHPLLRYICCPTCKNTLKNSSRALVCGHCDITYPIRSGIPILIDLSTLSPHLAGQVKYFEKEDTARSVHVLEPWQRRYVDNFLASPIRSKGLIIDNATGSGYMAIELAKQGYRVIAMDLTYAELVKLKSNIARLKLLKYILLVCASSEELPVKTNSADGMVANAILEHLPHEKKAINEIGRVLKKNAVLMLAMPIQLMYVWPFLWLVNMRHDRRIGHLRRYTRESIRKGFSKFREMNTYYTGSLGKIVCIMLKILTKNPQWDIWGENLDAYTSKIPYGSSNVVSILQKK